MERKPLVMIIDDVPEYREDRLPAMADGLGCRVCKAGNIQEALQLAKAHAPDSDDPLDLIVLDMHLPVDAEHATDVKNDGGVRFLHAYGLVRCPVVVYTAYPTFASCVSAILAGAIAYIPKTEKDKEGGPDALRDTWAWLLRERDDTAERVPPTREWIDRNYQELSKNFDGKYLALVDQMRLSEEEAAGRPIVDGLVLLSGDSYEDVRNQVIASPAMLKARPIIFMVRGAQSALRGGEE
jgi:CheY-like chemotaxis protein